MITSAGDRPSSPQNHQMSGRNISILWPAAPRTLIAELQALVLPSMYDNFAFAITTSSVWVVILSRRTPRVANRLTSSDSSARRFGAEVTSESSLQSSGSYSCTTSAPRSLSARSTAVASGHSQSTSLWSAGHSRSPTSCGSAAFMKSGTFTRMGTAALRMDGRMPAASSSTNVSTLSATWRTWLPSNIKTCRARRAISSPAAAGSSRSASSVSVSSGTCSSSARARCMAPATSSRRSHTAPDSGVGSALSFVSIGTSCGTSMTSWTASATPSGACRASTRSASSRTSRRYELSRTMRCSAAAQPSSRPAAG
mmetsp:Transcript_10485/g.38603  ORF Transcript_10485/g.38603 Transcript_10485/m.38603 type:complete len:312 (+) Transcript_10485:1348-2283(+)